jgi:hypothetical protein
MSFTLNRRRTVRSHASPFPCWLSLVERCEPDLDRLRGTLQRGGTLPHFPRPFRSDLRLRAPISECGRADVERFIDEKRCSIDGDFKSRSGWLI